MTCLNIRESGRYTKMRATTILAIVAIVAALGAVTSLIPVQHVSAAGPPTSHFPGGGQSESPCGGGGGHVAHPPFCR